MTVTTKEPVDLKLQRALLKADKKWLEGQRNALVSRRARISLEIARLENEIDMKTRELRELDE